MEGTEQGVELCRSFPFLSKLSTMNGWCVCVCTCVCKRERERDGKSQRKTYCPCLILLRQGLDERRNPELDWQLTSPREPLASTLLRARVAVLCVLYLAFLCECCEFLPSPCFGSLENRDSLENRVFHLVGRGDGFRLTEENGIEL